MIKLEEKLIELGYKKLDWARVYFIKRIKDFIEINIVVDRDCEQIESYYIESYIADDKDYKTLTQAFKRMKKDLEELKQCQD